MGDWTGSALVEKTSGPWLFMLAYADEMVLNFLRSCPQAQQMLGDLPHCVRSSGTSSIGIAGVWRSEGPSSDFA